MEFFIIALVFVVIVLGVNLLYAYRKLSAEIAEVHRLRGLYIETQLQLNSCRRELRKFPDSSVSKAERFRLPRRYLK